MAKRYVNHNGTMREHPNGDWCKNFDKDELIAEMAMQDILHKNYTIKLEEEIDELERVNRATTGIIDDLQRQLRRNKTMRKDSRYQG